MQRRSLRLFPFLIALCLVGCGGGAPQAQNATSTSAASTSQSHARAAAEPSDDGDASAAPAPKRATCDDGTCSPCGDALCPNGWYCDESAPGGPACGWLPECAKTAGCACVKKTFAACSCEDKNGAAHVACR